MTPTSGKVYKLFLPHAIVQMFSNGDYYESLFCETEFMGSEDLFILLEINPNDHYSQSGLRLKILINGKIKYLFLKEFPFREVKIS